MTKPNRIECIWLPFTHWSGGCWRIFYLLTVFNNRLWLIQYCIQTFDFHVIQHITSLSYCVCIGCLFFFSFLFILGVFSVPLLLLHSRFWISCLQYIWIESNIIFRVYILTKAQTLLNGLSRRILFIAWNILACLMIQDRKPIKRFIFFLIFFSVLIHFQALNIFEFRMHSIALNVC